MSRRLRTTRSFETQLEGFDGILVPGGFGKRGIEGMLNAIRYAREKKVPYFGICLGMQTACVEFARNVCGLKDANSSEFDPATQHRVIYKLRELLGVEEMGGTMRLGAWTCIIQPDTLAYRVYGDDGDQRAASPPLRIQSGVRGAADGRRIADQRIDAGFDLRRDRGDCRTSLLPRLPVPPRVQIKAAGAASSVPGVHSGELHEPARSS